MKQIFIKSARKVIQHKKELEARLNVKIDIQGTIVLINGEETDVYFASRVLEAIDYPFLIEDALLLKNSDFMFEVIPIKEHTRRHDYEVIKGRIIGKKGKTLKILEELSNCEIVVKDNNVAIIGPIEGFPMARQAVISLIQGSKQGHVYGILEKSGKRIRRIKKQD